MTMNPIGTWRRGVLPSAVHEHCGTTPGWHRWHQTDSYERYLEYGNKAFSIEDVSYEFNSNGFRCKEFSAIDHNAFKILTVGCSETLGVGIPLHLTFGEQLASLIRQRFAINSEVINLGAGGRSLDYITRALFQSIPILRPHYVFCLVPMMSRREYIIKRPHSVFAVPFGWWQNTDTFTHEPHDEALLELCTDTWDFFSMVKNLNMIELILRDTAWSWDTWTTPNDWKLPGFEAYINIAHYRDQPFNWEHRGRARDNMHNGVPYHTEIANDLITDGNLRSSLNAYLSRLSCRVYEDFSTTSA